MRLLGASPTAQPSGDDQLSGKLNTFIGRDPRGWHTNVPTYGRVVYHNVYPGVDAVYFSRNGQLEYEFDVAPGVDPSIIALDFEGESGLSADANGNLVVTLPGGGVLRHDHPQIYQETNGAQDPVAGGFVVNGHQVHFQVGAHSQSRPLVIDPVLSYVSDVGGNSIAVDGSGHAFVTGGTSLAFPTTSGAFQTSPAGNGDAYVAKLNSRGTALAYSTYLGGSALDSGAQIAVDAAGDAYVIGDTSSADFPLTSGAAETATSDPTAAFVTELNPSGSALVYSTLLGARAGTTGCSTEGRSIALHAGAIFVTGDTCSASFPSTSGAYQPTLFPGAYNAFIAKVNPATSGLSSLVYSTFLGGNGGTCGTNVAYDGRGWGIAVDGSGDAYVTGDTSSQAFPTTTGAFQPLPGGSCGFESFVTKLNAQGSALVYSTYLGGGSGTNGLGIAVDSGGRAFAVGTTSSSNFPVTSGAAQHYQCCGGNSQPYLSELSASGAALKYSTFIGQSYGAAVSVGIDSAGDAHVTGYSSSAALPVTADAFSKYSMAGADGFLTVINPHKSGAASVVSSTNLWGTEFGVALDSAGATYLTGFAPPGEQPPPSAGPAPPPGIGFVIKLSAGTPPHPSHANGEITTLAGCVAACDVDQPAPSAVAVHGTTVYVEEAANDIVIADDTRTGKISVVAGVANVPGYSGDGRSATGALLDLSSQGAGIAVDGSGNLYIADAYNCVVRRVSTTGIISTFAGNGICNDTGDGGPATSASLFLPEALAVDGSGDLYIADGQVLVRRVDHKTGVITTAAGNGQFGNYGDGGPATSAAFEYVWGIALDGASNLYISELNAGRVREVNAQTGNVEPFAGTTPGYCCDGQQATQAQIIPAGITTDSSGNVYVADAYNDRVRKVNTTGKISTVGGVGTSLPLNLPISVSADASGNLFVADIGDTVVRKLTHTGSASIVEGKLPNGDGGPASAAKLFPNALARDSAGNVYFGDNVEESQVRKYSPSTGTVTAFAGNGDTSYFDNGHTDVGDRGSAAAAVLQRPTGIAVDGAGNVYIADSTEQRVRKVDSAGTITTVAGNGLTGYTGDGGPAKAAEMSDPQGLAVDSAGHILYISDFGNNVVREVNLATGVITTVAGNGTSGLSGDGGPATAAELTNPGAVSVDAAGNLYIIDGYATGSGGTGCNIRRVAGATQAITTVAGTGNCATSGDGGPATSADILASGIATDASGDLLIADGTDIRMVTPAGVIGRLAGNGTPAFSGDGGSAVDASINPSDVIVDAQGNLYVSGSNLREVFDPPVSLEISPTPIAAAATLPAGHNVAVTLTARDLSGATLPNAAVDLSFTATTGGGSASVGTTPVNPTPGRFLTSSGGTIAISYTTAAVLPPAGQDTIAFANGTATPTIAGQDSYRYSNSISAYVFSPSPIAPEATLRAGQQVSIAFTAETNGAGVAGATVYLAFQRAAGNTSKATANGVALTANPSALTTNSSGVISISYTMGGNTLLSGTDTLTAEDATANPAVTASDTYTVTPIITTAAGNGTAAFSGDGGSATAASLDAPSGSAVDGSGNVYIADTNNQRIRKVGHSGTITTVAGNGTAGYAGDSGAATDAELSYPAFLAMDGSGNLYIDDEGNNVVRFVCLQTTSCTTLGGVSVAAGDITTVAGVAGASCDYYSPSVPACGDGGPATSAEFSSQAGPEGLAIDRSGNLLIVDSYPNARVREVSAATGVITSVAGQAQCACGSGVPASEAFFVSPESIAVDGSGDYFVGDVGGFDGRSSTNGAVWKIDASGTATVYAGYSGSNSTGYNPVGCGDGTRGLDPGTIAFDAAGNMFTIAAAQFYNEVPALICRIDTAGNPTPYAGNGTAGYGGDGGPATAAEINPGQVSVGAAGLYIADTGNNRVRLVSPA